MIHDSRPISISSLPIITDAMPTVNPHNSPYSVAVGDIVLYVLPPNNSPVKVRVERIRPAIVVAIWGTPTADDSPAVQLQVFTDNTNDFEPETPGANGVFWATSVLYSANKEPGTWHWRT